MKDIEKQLLETIKQQETKMDKDSLKKFENSIEDFNDLVKKGVAAPRGYRLQTIEEAYTQKWYFNVQLYCLLRHSVNISQDDIN